MEQIFVSSVQREMRAARQERRITNATYQAVTGASRPTAKRDIEDMVSKGILVPAGSGRGAHYLLSLKRLMNGSTESARGNGS